MTFVLDASATVPWFLDDEDDPQTEARISRLTAEGAIVPGLWHLAVGNVLPVALRRNRLSEDKLQFALRVLATAPITIDRHTSREAFGTALGLARQFDLSLYDAAYLVALATNDRALVPASMALDVPLA